ncbi:MAG: sodium/glutamate symporter, partial [Rhizobacter sp.]|nr:sodium/glutamate symporter [Rhizobacter sp.]
MKFDVDLYYTLTYAALALVIGYMLIDRVKLLASYSIPAAVVGGLLFAGLLTLVRGVAQIEVAFDGSLLTPLNIAFFTSVGLSADARALAKGGKTLVLFFVVVSAGLVMQNAIGVGLAMLFDMNPVNGLLAGSITLSGGHGTGAAWAGKFLEERNVQGAIELAVAAATYGLVAGGVIGGPL